jgi:predicted dehydrogenase
MKVGIIGCGLIGKKRAESFGDNTLVALADSDIVKAYTLALDYIGTKVFSDYKELLKEDIDIVVVATPNNMLAKIALDAINSGKHVLIEKPGAINYIEIDSLISAAKKNNVKVKVGYNLRYHRAINEAYHIADTGKIGEIIFIRAHYGHGGRLGYEKEWRADPSISGGGELIDQGSHLIDLSRCFLGDIYLKSSSVKTYFWDMPVEDNAFMILENTDGKTAFLSVSCTEWKNTFQFEIYGKYGKLRIDGLGGSYGTEKLTLYEMSPEMGIPEITTWEYYKLDTSFEREFMSFVQAIKYDLDVWSDLEESQKTLKIIDEIYKNNEVKI